MNSERKSFAAFAVTAALLLSSVPALVVAPLSSPAQAAGGAGGARAHLNSVKPAAQGAPLGLNPTFGPKGIVVTATGSGFSAVEPVTVTVIQGAVVDPIGTITSTSAGLITSTFSIPTNLAVGGIVIQATGAITNESQIFTINAPKLFLTPSSGTTGVTTTVTVNGTGYVPQAGIDITSPVLTIPQSAVADVNGAFTQVITIPATAVAGTFPVTATDHPNNNTQSAPFTNNPAPATATSTSPAATSTSTSTATGTPATATSTSTSTATGTPATATASATATTIPGPNIKLLAPSAGITVPTTLLGAVPLEQLVVIGQNFNSSTANVAFTTAGGLVIPLAANVPVSGGAFSQTVIIPSSARPVTNTVTASNLTQSASASVVIFTPTVTYGGQTLPAGSFITCNLPTNPFFCGSGFTANVPVSVTLVPTGTTASSAVATDTAPLLTDANGNFDLAGSGAGSLQIPSTAKAGLYQLYVTDAQGLTAVSSQPVTVTSITSPSGSNSLTLGLTNGNLNACALPAGAGASIVGNAYNNAGVQVNGSGGDVLAATLSSSSFAAGENINWYLNGTQITPLSTSSATFPGTNPGVVVATFAFTATQFAPGTYTLSAVGAGSPTVAASGAVATAVLVICPPTVNVSTNPVIVGQPASVTGGGFAANEAVSGTIYLASTSPVTVSSGAPGVTQVFTATASANGTYSAVFTPTLFGVYTLRATGVETFTSGFVTDLVTTTTFTVTAAGVTAVSGPVFPTANFVISATGGFSPTEIVSLTPAGGTTVTSTVNSSGGFVATLTAPAQAPLSGVVVTISSPSRGTITVTQPITVPTASLSASPNVLAVGGTTTVNGSGYIPNQPVNLAVYFAGANGALIPAGGSTAVVTASAAGAFTTSLTINPSIQTVNGNYVISGTSAASTLNTATTPITATSTGVITGPTGVVNQPTTIYFAEGYTGRFATNGKADFDEFISVLNPDNFTKTVTFTYQLQPGSVAPITTTTTFVTQIGPNTDILRSVNGDVGNDQIVSAIVSSNGRIAAERIINRTSPSGQLDADSSLGNTMPGTSWYFAEGYTGASFQEYLTVQNTSSAAATYTVTFLPPSQPAATPRQLSFTVPAGGRDTQNIRRLYLPFLQPGVAVRGGGESIGMLVTSNQPIVAERIEYWGDGNGSAKYGASAKPGATAPQTQYIFAYGSNPGASATGLGAAQSAGDESYVTVINPGVAGSSDATVLVKFYDKTGTFIGSKSITVSPQTRETVVVNNVIPTLSGPFYTIVTSDLPVFAEKPNYVGGSPNAGSHPGMSPSGSPAGIQSVLFPNVNTGTASGTAIVETVFLVNTSAQAETIVGTYYTPGGATAQVSYTVNPGALRVVNVNADAGNLPVGPLGAQYTTGFGGQFVAARIASSPSGSSYIGNQGVFNQ